jgi:hypothetical protein
MYRVRKWQDGSHTLQKRSIAGSRMFCRSFAIVLVVIDIPALNPDAQAPRLLRKKGPQQFVLAVTVTVTFGPNRRLLLNCSLNMFLLPCESCIPNSEGSHYLSGFFAYTDSGAVSMSARMIDGDPQSAQVSVPGHADSNENKKAAKLDKKDDLEEEEVDLDDTEGPEGHGNDPVLPVSAPKMPEASSGWDWKKVNTFLREDVDTDAAVGPLAAFCFMTVSCRLGFSDIVR